MNDWQLKKEDRERIERKRLAAEEAHRIEQERIEEARR